VNWAEWVQDRVTEFVVAVERIANALELLVSILERKEMR